MDIEISTMSPETPETPTSAPPSYRGLDSASTGRGESLKREPGNYWLESSCVCLTGIIGCITLVLWLVVRAKVAAAHERYAPTSCDVVGSMVHDRCTAGELHDTPYCFDPMYNLTNEEFLSHGDGKIFFVLHIRKDQKLFIDLRNAEKVLREHPVGNHDTCFFDHETSALRWEFPEIAPDIAEAQTIMFAWLVIMAGVTICCGTMRYLSERNEKFADCASRC